MKSLIYAIAIASILPVTACSKDFDNSTVDRFDLSRYLGEWYEVMFADGEKGWIPSSYIERI